MSADPNRIVSRAYDNNVGPPPELSSQPSAEFLGPRGCMRTWKNAQGMDIASYYWPAEGAPRGLIALVHGHGSYICFDYLKVKGLGTGHQLYEGSWIQAMNKAGYSVSGNDQQGCGRSSGLRCFAERFDNYVQDTIQHAKECTTLGLDGFPSASDPSTALPLFLMGMSMGGCVVLTAGIKAHPALFSGVVCLAPMISLEKIARKGLNPYLRPLGSFLSAIVPKLPALVVNRNTTYPELQASYDQDPGTYHSSTRVRTGQEYMQATEWLCAHLGDISFPFISFHSEDDTQCDPEGSKKLYAEAKSTDKQLRLLKGFWHVLMKEPGNETIRDEVIAWLHARTPAK